METLNLLKGSFNDCVIVQRSPPSYIQCHIVNNKEIVLVFNKTYQQNESSISSPKKRDITNLSEYEVTGSPLKLNLDYDKLEETLLVDLSTFWSHEENTHQPLLLTEARNIINFYNSKLNTLDDKERLDVWVICDAQDSYKTIALGAFSQDGWFSRGIINYMGIFKANSLKIEHMEENHLNTYGCPRDKKPLCTIEGIYRISGRRSKTYNQKGKADISSSVNGMTQLECQWSKSALHAPLHETSIQLVQEVIIGHESNECTVLWKSVGAIQGIRNALLSLTNVLTPNVITDISIRPYGSNPNGNSSDDIEIRLQELLNETENYSGLPHGPKGGCICISEDNTNLQQVFKQYSRLGSSNDFTYRLWDIFKDCNTVEELINLLVDALKYVYKRNLRPYIDPSNTTFIGSLVKKLARGLSQQAIKSLSSFRTNPTRALNIIAQLGMTKLCWEYTNIFSLVDNALGFNNRLRLQNKVSEINEEIFNQTILDMTLGSGDVTVNPFDTKFNLMDSTIVQEADTTITENIGDLTLDNFASLKKHNIEVKTDRKLQEKDQPLISDDADIEITSKEWKFKLSRLAQLHVCLEHLYRAQLSLNCDFGSLRAITTQLLDFYTDDESPIKTVPQLHNEPAQLFSVPIQYKNVKEHLQFKYPTMYRISFQSDSFEDNKKEESGEAYQTIKTTFVYSQQNIFPPSIFVPDINDADVVDDGEIIYYGTKYVHLKNRL